MLTLTLVTVYVMWVLGYIYVREALARTALLEAETTARRAHAEGCLERLKIIRVGAESALAQINASLNEYARRLTV